MPDVKCPEKCAQHGIQRREKSTGGAKLGEHVGRGVARWYAEMPPSRASGIISMPAETERDVETPALFDQTLYLRPGYWWRESWPLRMALPRIFHP